mmetsp:Transcript_52836/g.84353  ORF Transcript_52836/g.84353 Transcript_52836/m.84353 type:complete len:264 (+) Transcript_52836:473-1264(+)
MFPKLRVGAEGGHVDTQQLQLGGQITALISQPRGGAAQRRRQHLRLLRARLPQAVDHAVMAGHFPHGVDVGITAAETAVHLDSASWAEVQVAGARQVIARADAAGHDQEIQSQVNGGAILQKSHSLHPGLVREDFGDLNLHMHHAAQRLHLALQQLSRHGVQLRRHQVRCALDDVRLHPQIHQCLGCLQPQQAAADDSGATGALGTRDDGVHIFDGSIEEDARDGGVQSRDRRHKGRAARGQDQLIIFQLSRCSWPLVGDSFM